MIVIHQMGMCPELYLDLSLDKDLPALRALAFVLNRYRRSSKFTGPSEEGSLALLTRASLYSWPTPTREEEV